MARKIIGDQLRYGDIEAAYSEPNYLGAGLGVLGATIHKLANEDKAEEKVKTPTQEDPAADSDDRVTSSVSQQMVYQSALGQLQGNQSRNRGENILGQIGGAGSSGGMKMTDEEIQNQLGPYEKEMTPQALMAIIKSNPGLLAGFPRLKSPLERTTTGQKTISSDRLTTGQRRTANRLAPQSYTTGSNIRVDEEQEMQALSFLGEEGAAFAEGFNVGIKNRNYARRVWAQQQKDMSDAFGELEVKPSGSTSYDSSVEQVAEEKVNEMAELMSQRNKIKPIEFTKRYNELKNWTNEMNSASIAVKELVTNYAKDKDSISGGTNPEILDAIDTLSKGGRGLTIKNINGITTLTGKTLSGKNVSIPVSELATTNRLRYLKKVDVESFYSNILNGDGKNNKGILSNKTWMSNGLTAQQKLMAYDGALGNSVKYQVDNFLDNPGTIRAIAAERLGIPYYAFEEKYGDNMELAKQDVSNHLQDQIKQRYAVKAGITYQLKKDPGYPGPDTDKGEGKSRTDLIRQRAMEILAVSPKGDLSESDRLSKSFKPKYNLILGKKGVGGVEQIGNELQIFGNEDDEGNREVLKKIPLSNIGNAVDILTNFLLEDKNYSLIKRNKGKRSAQEIYDQYVKSKNNI